MTKHLPHTHAITIRLGADLMAAMERVHERDGISTSEMMRRALRAWLEDKDDEFHELKEKAARQRGAHQAWARQQQRRRKERT